MDCWTGAASTAGVLLEKPEEIEESGDALPVAKSRMSILERAGLSQVRERVFRASAPFPLKRGQKNL